MRYDRNLLARLAYATGQAQNSQMQFQQQQQVDLAAIGAVMAAKAQSQSEPSFAELRSARNVPDARAAFMLQEAARVDRNRELAANPGMRALIQSGGTPEETVNTPTAASTAPTTFAKSLATRKSGGSFTSASGTKYVVDSDGTFRIAPGQLQGRPEDVEQFEQQPVRGNGVTVTSPAAAPDPVLSIPATDPNIQTIQEMYRQGQLNAEDAYKEIAKVQNKKPAKVDARTRVSREIAIERLELKKLQYLTDGFDPNDPAILKLDQMIADHQSALDGGGASGGGWQSFMSRFMGADAAAPAAPASPPLLLGSPAGITATGPDGRKYVVQNGQWVPA